MKMKPLYEWPELDRRSAESYAQYHADRLAKHERGELDEPLTAEEVESHRQHWAELNYLAHGQVANPLTLPSVNDIDWDEDYYDDDLDYVLGDHIPPDPELQPIADDNVFRKGMCVMVKGTELWGVQRELEADLDRVTDVASKDALEIKHRLVMVREAITEQVKYLKAEV